MFRHKEKRDWMVWGFVNHGQGVLLVKPSSVKDTGLRSRNCSITK